ncbi:MAG: twin-arginine translocase TatA/TatE family subunit [Flavobacteriales bacterium]|nr:twin-arginine translocase TatA/TatE family subunit [Flavobacteriales bacterium]
MRIALLFDVSGGEFLIILLFILLFFGAKGIPDIARGMGRFMRQVRDASNEVQREINRGASDVRRSAEEHQRQFRNALEEAPAPHKQTTLPSATPSTEEKAE